MEFVSWVHRVNELETYIDGYVKVYVGQGNHPHSNKGFVLLHRLVMEAFLERYLEPSEVVHHINEIKTDNRIQNLYLCSQEEHVQIHNRGTKPSLERRKKIRQGVIRANKQRAIK